MKIFGGGGGSRTRVRKPSAAASTYVAAVLSFAAESSQGQDPSATIPFVVSPLPQREKGIGYPAFVSPYLTRQE